VQHDADLQVSRPADSGIFCRPGTDGAAKSQGFIVFFGASLFHVTANHAREMSSFDLGQENAKTPAQIAYFLNAGLWRRCLR